MPAFPILISLSVLDAHKMCCHISAEQQTESLEQLKQEEEEGEGEEEEEKEEEGELEGELEGEGEDPV